MYLGEKGGLEFLSSESLLPPAKVVEETEEMSELSWGQEVQLVWRCTGAVQETREVQLVRQCTGAVPGVGGGVQVRPAA